MLLKTVCNHMKYTITNSTKMFFISSRKNVPTPLNAFLVHWLQQHFVLYMEHQQEVCARHEETNGLYTELNIRPYMFHLVSSLGLPSYTDRLDKCSRTMSGFTVFSSSPCKRALIHWARYKPFTAAFSVTCRSSPWSQTSNSLNLHAMPRSTQDSAHHFTYADL